MKAFYATTVIFLLLIGVIWGNNLFINRVTRELEQEIDALPRCADAADAVRVLDQRWEHSRHVIGVSVSSDILLRMCDHIAEMKAAVTAQSDADFERARELARATVISMRDAERITVDNLF